MAEEIQRTRLLAFTTELERLMIAYRIENGHLLWNQDDVNMRDKVINWATNYANNPPVNEAAARPRATQPPFPVRSPVLPREEVTPTS